METRVTVIPATLNPHTSTPLDYARKKRVAAYARVSTEYEEQLSSYKAQVNYYTEHINENPQWEFASVYTDEGITATSTKKRDGFNRMIKDAIAGKIDLILTKSISRFARNTVDTLTFVRKLREHGVEVYFEKENIYSFDTKGELVLTLVSSLAQEESHAISENVKWGLRKRFADGQVVIQYKRFLGYEQGPDGRPQVVEEEAKTIRLIYQLYLEGMTASAIARHLTSSGNQTPSGKEKWCNTTVTSILKNEKYIGDALLQKTVTTDFLTKRSKKNEGEAPKYYIENSHEAIVSKETYDLVQSEMKRRSEIGARTGCRDILSGHLICGDCGCAYGSKVWHSTSKYRRVIWQCNSKFRNEDRCQTPHVQEERIKELFVRAVNELIGNRDEKTKACEAILKLLGDDSDLVRQKEAISAEKKSIHNEIEKLITLNATKVLDQKDYDQKYAELLKVWRENQGKETALDAETEGRRNRMIFLRSFLQVIKKRENIITRFEEGLWHALLIHVEIKRDGLLSFVLQDGSRIDIPT